MPLTRHALVVAAAASLAGGLSGTALGADYIYWSADDRMGSAPSAIGRANLDGTDVRPSLISNAGDVRGLAADGNYLYWIDSDPGNPYTRLGRATREGGGANASFATVSGSVSANPGMAITATHAYVIMATTPNEVFGRVGLDGSSPNASLFAVPGGSGFNVAGAGDSLYWATPGNPNTIGRVGITGSPSSPGLVTPASGAAGALAQSIAVSGSHIYWSNPSGGAIARANLDGTGRNAGFITGINSPIAVAVSSTHVYWTAGDRTIGRAALDGSGVTHSFISTGASAGRDLTTLAVSSGGEPAPTPGPSGGSGTASGNTTPGTTPTPTATTTASPTQTAKGRDSQVVVKLQLSSAGRYTFIYERGVGAAARRIPMQKGSKIGKRVLKKTTTAANLTTTAADARVVVNSLLPRAQANRWRLRVIRTASDGTQTQSVITK